MTATVPLSIPALVAQDFRVLMKVQGVGYSRPARKSYRKRGRCAKCAVPRSLETMTVDHIVPQCLLKAYPRIRNHSANKQTLCAPCNNAKGDGAAVDYRNDLTRHRTLITLLRQAGLSIQVIFEPGEAYDSSAEAVTA